MKAIDNGDITMIDVSTRIRERISDADRERAANAASRAGPAREGMRRRVGLALVAAGTAIGSLSRHLESEADDGCEEAGGAV